MKIALTAVAVLAGAGSLASSAFVTPPFMRALASRPSGPTNAYPARPMRMAERETFEEGGKVYYASQVTDGFQKTKLEEELGDQRLQESAGEVESDRFGPANYDGFVDSEGFDGGDGQVGVVGDGSNAMEKFDESAVSTAQSRRAQVRASTFVQESKSRQRNAWGGGTGYADELKEKGMVSTNLYGEDTSKVRRQQFENWRQQQEITSRQRAEMNQMEAVTGALEEDSAPKWKRGTSSYFDKLSETPKQGADEAWNKYSAPVASGMKDGSQWAEPTLTGNEKIEDTVQCVSISGRPGHATIKVRSSVMTYEPFHCTFVGDTRGFNVTPMEGTLNRRGGDPTELDVSYKGNGPGDNRIGTLVVETEEDKWVFKIEGAMG